MTILYAFLWFAGIALVLGAMLAIASIVFEVKVDPKIPEVTEVLPGANCGGCGFSGCAACAEAIVKGEAKVSACPVGGQAVADQVAAIMGVDAGSVTRMRAQVMCSGTRENAKQKYIYEVQLPCVLAAAPRNAPTAVSASVPVKHFVRRTPFTSKTVSPLSVQKSASDAASALNPAPSVSSSSFRSMRPSMSDARPLIRVLSPVPTVRSAVLAVRCVPRFVRAAQSQ